MRNKYTLVFIYLLITNNICIGNDVESYIKIHYSKDKDTLLQQYQSFVNVIYKSNNIIRIATASDGNYSLLNKYADKYNIIETDYADIIGIDEGEWGGGLYCIPKYHMKPPYIIDDMNMVSIEKWNDKIIILCYDIYNNSKMRNYLKLLNVKNNKYTTNTVIKYGYKPLAFSILNDKTAYIINMDEIYEIYIEKDQININKKYILAEKLNEKVYSTECNSSYIYLGCRGYIIKINLDNENEIAQVKRYYNKHQSVNNK